MKSLNGMSQSRTIVLYKNVGADFDNAVRSQADELAVESAVM